ncbi:MAG: hypothetical protein ACW99G_23660 [Candidatus Thorarchaeota archaeon]|jgi:hypothetical protein
MIDGDDRDAWTAEELNDFDAFQNDVYYVIRTLLACCLARKVSRSDELNSAVDVLVLVWMFSSFSSKSPTDVEYASGVAFRYKTMQDYRDVETVRSTESCLSELRALVVSDTGKERLRKVSHTIDWMYSEQQKDQCGHSWRDQLSGASADTLLHSILNDISPTAVEAGMLLLLVADGRFNPIEFGEFLVSRFRSRMDSYKEAAAEVQLRMLTPDWN